MDTAQKSGLISGVAITIYDSIGIGFVSVR